MGIPRVISASLSPNTEGDDVLRALRMFLTPWLWRHGSSLGSVSQWFADYLGVKESPVFFTSGRSALLAILKGFDIGAGDEVIVQAFTCVAVPNSVLWAGATPVYADIDTTYNIDPDSIATRITANTKAVIVQHTFGIPADMHRVRTLAKKHNLIIIEDCAHALGATYKGKPLGVLGDAAFFSFGRDKPFSSVWGGAAFIRSMHKKAVEKLIAYQGTIAQPSVGWIAQQLFHPILFAFVLPLYNVGIGKLLLFFSQRLRLVSFPVFAVEKTGGKPALFPALYPNALAYLLIGQLHKIKRYTKMREETALYYAKTLKKVKGTTLPTISVGSVPLRYTIQVTDPNRARARAKSQGVLLGNWYASVIDPVGVSFNRIGYEWGSCPRAEVAATHVLNLPTRISIEAAQTVVAIITSQ